MDSQELMLEIEQALLTATNGMSFNELKKLLGVHPRMLKSAIALLCMNGRVLAMGNDKVVRSNNRYFHAQRVQLAPPSARQRVFEPYRGEDWDSVMLRDGCRDHEKYGSRQNDTVIPYRGIRCIY